MKNQAKQINDLKRQLMIEKNKNSQLQLENEFLKNTIKLSKENNRKQEHVDWRKLLGRNTYDDEKHLIRRIWKNFINIIKCIIKFFSLRSKDIKGTHVSFTLKKTISSTFFIFIACSLICLAIHLVFPSLFLFINEFIKSIPWLWSFLVLLFKITCVIFLFFIAKVFQIISFEVDNSYDDEFVDSMLTVTSKSITKK